MRKLNHFFSKNNPILLTASGDRALLITGPFYSLLFFGAKQLKQAKIGERALFVTFFSVSNDFLNERPFMLLVSIV
jgi:hypothetical protein